MMKLTLMVRFTQPGKKQFDRKPAAYGKSGRVKPGSVEYKDPETKKLIRVDVGICTYDIRVEDKGTTYVPAGKNGTEAEAKRLRMMAKATGREGAESAGLTVTDPETDSAKRIDLREQFDEYIEDAQKRDALEAKEQAILVSTQFLAAIKIKFLDEVSRSTILDFDGSLRAAGRSKRTISNKRQRLQSMLRWAGIDPMLFPPKPKYDKKLPTIYTQIELEAIFGVANPYQTTVCHLALKLGLRDQEIQFSEFTDISWEESVYRVRSKPKFGFTVKDYEERDIPIPLDFLEELKQWRSTHPKQNLIVPTSAGRPNGKLLKMVKRLARRAGIECGWCPNCIAKLGGERGCDEIELHKFRRTCITTWLRNPHIDPRTVMEYAGHADMATTQRYARPAAASERIAAVSEIKWY
jgi:integrase